MCDTVKKYFSSWVNTALSWIKIKQFMLRRLFLCCMNSLCWKKGDIFITDSFRFLAEISFRAEDWTKPDLGLPSNSNVVAVLAEVSALLVMFNKSL
jgi:hypothetical protein